MSHARVSPTIRLGIVGLGGNARLRHVGGFRACENVEIHAVCNRRRESTEAVAREFDIPKTYDHWQDLVADPELDAVLIGAWPYLHCPATLAALQAGKHVLTEARMAMNADEARQMLEASERRPELVCQIVPSPLGLRAHRVVQRMIDSGYLGQLREVIVTAANDSLADAETPLGWRQVRELSGLNMLTLGIVHETVARWVPPPVRVFADAKAFVPQRFDPATGILRQVGTPDSVHVLAVLADGAHALYHVSGVARFAAGTTIQLYGSEGTIHYELAPRDRLRAARRGESELREVDVPADQALRWRVEEEFISAIRGEERIEFTPFGVGLRYMQFTEAVARSAASGGPIDLP
jgi:predicted dehydrogenase